MFNRPELILPNMEKLPNIKGEIIHSSICSGKGLKMNKLTPEEVEIFMEYLELLAGIKTKNKI